MFQKLRDSSLVDSSVLWHGFHPHRIRLNEYFYRHLPMKVPDEDLAECVFGTMSLVVDAGSFPDVPLDVDYLETFVYDLFSDLESFLQVFSSSITDCSTIYFVQNQAWLFRWLSCFYPGIFPSIIFSTMLFLILFSSFLTGCDFESWWISCSSSWTFC